MKNTMMIRSLMLAGLVLGSSFAQADWKKTVAKVAPKSFVSQKKGAILTAGVVGLGALLVASVYKYKNSKAEEFKDLKGAKGYAQYMWANTKHYTNATFSGIKNAACWTGRTAKAGFDKVAFWRKAPVASAPVSAEHKA